MKTAKSLVYGGELIEAIDCTYEDFKRLAPLCPNCSSPVHLKAGGDRTSTKGKHYKIPQHWAHFAGKSAEEVAACELRVNGYSDAEKEKIQRVARGQREKWIQLNLVKIIDLWWERWTKHLNSEDHHGAVAAHVLANSSGLVGLPGINVLGSKMPDDSPRKRLTTYPLPESLVCSMSELLKNRALLRSSLFANKEPTGLIDLLAEASINSKIPMVLMSSTCDFCVTDPCLTLDAVKSLKGLDFLLHKKIVYEVVQFLFGKSSRDKLSFVWLAFMADLLDMVRDSMGGMNILGITFEGSTAFMVGPGFGHLARVAEVRLIQFLFCIPWASEFARLEALEAVKAPHA